MSGRSHPFSFSNAFHVHARTQTHARPAHGMATHAAGLLCESNCANSHQHDVAKTRIDFAAATHPLKRSHTRTLTLHTAPTAYPQSPTPRPLFLISFFATQTHPPSHPPSQSTLSASSSISPTPHSISHWPHHHSRHQSPSRPDCLHTHTQTSHQPQNNTYKHTHTNTRSAKPGKAVEQIQFSMISHRVALSLLDFYEITHLNELLNASTCL